MYFTLRTITCRLNKQSDIDTSRTGLTKQIGHEGIKSVTDRRENTAVGIGRGINSRLRSVM